MVGSVLLLLIINAIIFSFIFWILTYLAKNFYSNKYYNYKLNFYECGFKSITNIKINYNINYILLILFLIIYDGEFLILIPFSLNVSMYTFLSISLLLFFLVWLLCSLLLDYAYNALDWQV